jgi:hypothetical protein
VKAVGGLVRVGAGLVAGGFLLLAQSFAALAQPSGVTIAVVQQAEANGENGQRVLQPEAPVYSGDKIVTGPIGVAQVRFRDDTKLVVGPNSTMVIDAFIFNDDDTARKISINAVRGAFRFITGNSSKDAYTITTPTATIGVRGSEFDISVEAEGTTRVADFEGTTNICRRDRSGGVVNPDRDCVVVTDPCTLSVIRPSEPGVVMLSNDDIEYRNRQLQYYFPYTRSQDALQFDFQVDLRACTFAAIVVPEPDVIGPPGPPIEPPPPIPTPGPPELPVFVPPDAPVVPAEREHDRNNYDHGPVFR